MGACDLSGKSQPPAASCKYAHVLITTTTAAPSASNSKPCHLSLSMGEMGSLMALACTFAVQAVRPRSHVGKHRDRLPA